MKNFKVRCVKGFNCFTEGKIYEVKDGVIHDNDDYPIHNVKSVEQMNKIFVSKFELVEEEKKTPFQYMLDYYNIKVGEVFLLDGFKVYFDDDGTLLYKDGTGTIGFKGKCFMGTANIEKLPCKPKNGDIVWKVGTDGNLYTGSFTEQSSPNVAMFKLGWIFKTKEEAEANKERVLAEMKEVLNG